MSAKVERITVICHWCGKPHQRPPSWIASVKTNRFFCCNQCKQAWEKRERIPVRCHTCGKEFAIPPSEHKLYQEHYCSRECRKTRQHVTCYHCGETIERPAHVLEKSKSGRFFCSQECKSAWGKTTKRMVQCEECGKEFERYNRHMERDEHQFCSMKCEFVWNGCHKRGEKHPRWRVDKKTVQCEMCGTIFVKPDHQIIRDTHHFCSRACHAEWKSHNQTGENNPAWTGGKATYYGPNWKAQIRAARKRDGYHCRACGKSQKQNGRALDVHHIVPFRTFGYIPEENDAYLEANKLTNLISLCQICHKRAEHEQIPIQPNLL